MGASFCAIRSSLSTLSFACLLCFSAPSICSAPNGHLHMCSSTLSLYQVCSVPPADLFRASSKPTSSSQQGSPNLPAGLFRAFSRNPLNFQQYSSELRAGLQRVSTRILGAFCRNPQSVQHNSQECPAGLLRAFSSNPPTLQSSKQYYEEISAGLLGASSRANRSFRQDIYELPRQATRNFEHAS